MGRTQRRPGSDVHIPPAHCDPLIAVVDDDESVRESLPDLLRQLGFSAESFASAAEFLQSEASSRTRCLILDLAMPGMSGIELWGELRARQWRIPIVFITAHADAATRPGLLAEGAIECLAKPFSDTALLAAVETALRGTRA